jgi:hypothetical protein
MLRARQATMMITTKTTMMSACHRPVTIHAAGLTAPNCTKSTPTKDTKTRKISWYFVQIRCSQ